MPPANRTTSRRRRPCRNRRPGQRRPCRRAGHLDPQSTPAARRTADPACSARKPARRNGRRPGKAPRGRARVRGPGSSERRRTTKRNQRAAEERRATRRSAGAAAALHAPDPNRGRVQTQRQRPRQPRRGPGGRPEGRRQRARATAGENRRHDQRPPRPDTTISTDSGRQQPRPRAPAVTRPGHLANHSPEHTGKKPPGYRTSPTEFPEHARSPAEGRQRARRGESPLRQTRGDSQAIRDAEPAATGTDRLSPDCTTGRGDHHYGGACRSHSGSSSPTRDAHRNAPATYGDDRSGYQFRIGATDLRRHLTRTCALNIPNTPLLDEEIGTNAADVSPGEPQQLRESAYTNEREHGRLLDRIGRIGLRDARRSLRRLEHPAGEDMSKVWGLYLPGPGENPT